MSERIHIATEILQTAEGSLRELMEAAVKCGNYDEVAYLAPLAQQISQLSSNGTDREVKSSTKQVFQRTTATKRHRASVNGPVGRTRRGARPKIKYPVFKRDGDRLAKIGWSKSSREEYQHQAPKEVAVALAARLCELSKAKELIVMEDVLPLHLDGSGIAVPDYQCYVCLAWFRNSGIVNQHGRKGYTISNPKVVPKAVEAAWTALELIKL